MADQQAAADRQAVINDAVAAALAAFHNAQAAARQGVQAPFALTPALANIGYIDFSKAEGLRLYKMATEKLEITFEGKPNQLLLLNQAIGNKAGAFGFDTTIMTIPDDDGIDRDLVSEHGMLSHEAISNWATANIVGQQTRTAQDNEMFYTCLFNSTSEDVKKKLLSKTSKINGTEIAALLYKHLIATTVYCLNRRISPPVDNAC